MYRMKELVRVTCFHCTSHQGVDRYPPPSAQNRAEPIISNFVDGSGQVFSMYMEMATEEDKKMVENWKADADGILIFVRLYYLIPCLMQTRLS
jgi:hypothetical protein